MVGKLSVRKNIGNGMPFDSLVNEHSVFCYHGRPWVMKTDHWHNHIEFNFIKKGYVEYSYDGQDVTLPTGELIFFWGAIPHRVINHQLEKSNDFHVFHYPIEDFLICDFDKRLHRLLLNGHILRLKAPSLFIEQFFELWHLDLQEEKNHTFDRINSDISALLNRFSPEILSVPSTSAISKSKEDMPNMALFGKILRFIFEHFQDDIHNQDIADHLGYHENYIQRIFKDFSGYSIRQFIIHLRLKYACSMLRNTNRSIFNIAIETGFGSISRFYKAFGDTYQKTPKQYRLERS